MSRLDQHVAKVQNKLALARFIIALAWTTLGFAIVVTLVLLEQKTLRYMLPKPLWFLFGGAGAAVIVALIYAIIRRPNAKAAAVAIDEKLCLKEKISTALFMRPNNDPFAAAAVKDAED